MSEPTRILLVDDDPQSLESTRKILDLSGFDVTTAVDGQDALERVRPTASGSATHDFDLILTDVRMPRLGGLEFLRALSLCGEKTPVILMTAFGRVEDAVWAMKLGAVDFLSKPFKRQALITAIEAALKRARPARGSAQRSASAEPDLIGSSSRMSDLKAQIDQVAPTLATVLLSGESGTGKELVAKLIHLRSNRAKGPFIALNCAAVPENLMESELFGFEKGAFTGATSAKEGLFEAANGGTLLLDEIGDMPLTLQAKLLRALQEGEVRRLGATASRKIDVRVIGATHRDLAESVRAGSFRQDLLYRLEVVSLRVPALRERLEDVPELSRHFLAIASLRHAKQVDAIEPSALETLMAHSWPGNVRELSNVIERAVVFARGGTITSAELPPHLKELVGNPRAANGGRTIEVPIGTPLKDVEELLIRRTLEATSGDKSMTARLLGVNQRTIYRKLEESKRQEGEGETPPPPREPELS